MPHQNFFFKIIGKFLNPRSKLLFEAKRVILDLYLVSYRILMKSDVWDRTHLKSERMGNLLYTKLDL